MASGDPKLPEPLVGAEVDLRDFPRMPVAVERLRKSKAWLLAKKKPELGFYMLNLWMSSWHETPPASLEDDDDVLMDRAMCSEKRWSAVREIVLRNWVKCSDGRLYHATVAEMVQFAWQSKVKQRGRTGAATAAAKAKRDGKRTDPVDPGNGDAGDPYGDRDGLRDDGRDGHATDSKGKVEIEKVEIKGAGRDSSEAKASGALAPVPPAPPAPPPAPRPKITDPDEIIFGYGVPLLTVAGSTDKHARSFLAGLRKYHGDTLLIEKLRECIKAKPLQPLEWLAKALPPPGKPGKADAQRREETDAEAMRLLGIEPGGDVIDA